MNMGKKEDLSHFKTGNYIKLEELCKKILFNEITDEEFLEQIDWFNDMLDECELEHEQFLDIELESEDLEETQDRYFKGIEIYRKGLIVLEKYLTNRNSEEIYRGLELTLKGNKILLEVQSMSEEKEQNLQETEGLFKKSVIGHEMAIDLFSIATPLTQVTPLEDLEIKEQLEKTRKKSKIMGLIPLFSVLNEKEIERICSKVKLERVDGDTALFDEGQLGTELYIIKSGEVIIYKDLGQGEIKDHITLSKGDLFGEMAIILENRRTLSARIGEDGAELYVINSRDFVKMLNTYPGLNLNLSRILCERLKNTNVRLLNYLSSYFET